MNKNHLARELVLKFPHTSKKQLGRMLVKLYPDKFNDEDDARSKIRAVTGSKGNDRAMTVNYSGLPQGKHNDYSPLILPPGKYGVLSDIHIPAHDDRAVGLALEHLRKNGITNLILNGDVLDCYQLSDHIKDPSEAQFKAEIAALRPWLKHLIKIGFKKIVYKLANHEERLERVLIQKAPSLFGIEVLSWEALISVEVDYDEDGKTPKKVWTNNLLDYVTVVGNKRIIKAGKLSIVHGHEFGKSIIGPINPARGFFLKANASVIGGHFHRISEHVETDINGKVTGCWSTGCLCDLRPKYAPINKWQHGFAVVEHDGDGFEVQNFKIIDGKVK